MSLKEQFSYAPAWGQAGFQDRGNVSVPAIPDTEARSHDTEANGRGPRGQGSSRPGSLLTIWPKAL
jgi:hypothetical protein